MALFCIISEIKRDTDQNRYFCHTLCIRDAVRLTFGTEKLEWCGYPTWKKFYMFSRFNTISACDRQTDRQTDILRQHSAAVISALHMPLLHSFSRADINITPSIDYSSRGLISPSSVECTFITSERHIIHVPLQVGLQRGRWGWDGCPLHARVRGVPISVHK